MMSDWLLLHAGALGDLALTLGLLLSEPQIQRSGLTVISRVTLDALADAIPAIRFYSSDALGLHALFSDETQIPARLYELIRDRHVVSALGDKSAPVNKRIAGLSPRALHCFDPRPTPDSVRHVTEQWRTRLAGDGLLLRECDYHRSAALLRLSAESRQRGTARMQRIGVGESPILIAPGGGGVHKQWPLARYVELVRRIGSRACFLLGPVELDTWDRDVIDDIEREFPIIRSLDAASLLETLAGAALLIANDSGPAHVAALIGVPVIALFGPTDTRLWSPQGRDVRAIQGEVAAPDWGITVDRVIAEVR